MSTATDRLGRELGSLRVSVTDRCNMRCRYCMPEDEYQWLPRSSILSFEEITRLAGVFASLGAGKVRLTGGEPLLRHDLARLVGQLSAVEGVRTSRSPPTESCSPPRRRGSAPRGSAASP